MSSRVTIKVQHKKKYFYERFLSAFKDTIEDRKQNYVLYKALHNLKNSPFDVQSIVDLKAIEGIGENIAVKCEEAWLLACEQNGREFTLAELLSHNAQFLDKLLEDLLKPRKKKRKHESVLPGATRSLPDDDEFVEEDEKELPAKKVAPSLKNPVSESTFRPKALEPTSSSVLPQSQDSSQEGFCHITCHPYEQPQVVLIADSREHRNSNRKKSVVEHLVTNNAHIRVDMRALSVGDYLWVTKKVDGSELVMDWVVERKTWQDLHSSIRKGRYDEQKDRLGRAPMKNRIYLIEGSSRGESPSEQALASTLTNGGFLIQRCADTRETAEFLGSVSLYLQKKAETSQLSGVSFENLQEASKKEKAETVKDAWVRQLMVCPGMSYSRAQAIADHFPSMISLSKFFEKSRQDAQMELQKLVPQITRPVAKNLYKFFLD
ncbi:unnamed protein product [Caenorhabditis auriculariae]|uniref:Crossover junction endonuclease MUS81 n=1 Tax=Caenorhabditis auriculariae TaxID=2777116 RepID=A0A8S1GM51_9PELO|nr:unnamed protein product [Caenorhabditis auriculariae]